MNTYSGGEKRGAGDRGFILVTSYLLIAVLEIFSIAFFSRSNTFFQAVERNQNKIVAFNMAEAGVDNTLVQLLSSSTYAGTGSYTSLGSNGGYQVVVCPPTCTGLTIPLDTDIRLIQATGYAPGNITTSKAYETRTILSYAELDSTPFDYAVFGDTSITFSGNATIDSYNSVNGAYGGANATSKGHVASDGPATLSGNTNIKGDLTSTTAALNGNAKVSGNATTESGTVSLTGNASVTGSQSSGQTPGLDCGPGSTSLPNLGTLSISGNNTITLPAGSYHYNSVSISGNGTLSLTGAVTLYVDGSVSVSGNGISTASDIPTNLMIVALDDKSISFSGNGNFYGAVYAPDSSVTNSGNGQVYGAVIANTYNQSGNGNVHFDEGLKNIPAPCSNVSFLAWQEQGTAAS